MLKQEALTPQTSFKMLNKSRRGTQEEVNRLYQ